MHYAVPRILAGAGRLERFYTDICALDGVADWVGHLPAGVRSRALRRLAGRIPHGVPRDKVVTFPAFGLRHALRRQAMRSIDRETQIALWAGQRFSELVCRHGFGNAAGMFGYNGECLEQLAAARAAGLWTAVEQTVAARDVLDRLRLEEQERFPDWQPPMKDGHGREAAARERAEWAEADVILCGSEFVRDSIAASGGPLARCIVVPYGIDVSFAVAERAPHTGPLRVLTIGEVGLRKGAPYVLEAARRMGRRATFRMVGPSGVLPAAWAQMARFIDMRGPVPRSEMAAQFAWADVMLLPSICEGSATAVYEALAAGLPVVCTPNTGSVVRDGQDGFVVPIRDVDAIVERLVTLATKAQLRIEMGRSATTRAAGFTVAEYGRRLLSALHRPARAPFLATDSLRLAG
jgi:glycosyltransferase involved in cell wall biosynthesis